MSSDKIEKSKISHFDMSDIKHKQQYCNEYITAYEKERSEYYSNNELSTYFLKDISDTVNIFSSLKLLPDYRIVAYSDRSNFHGSSGRVFAKQLPSSKDELIDNKIDGNDFIVNKIKVVSDTIIDPFEAIKGDESPISFVDAVILSYLFWAIPKMAFRFKYTILDRSPFTNNKSWEIFTDLNTWQPLLISSDDYQELRLCIQHEKVRDFHTMDTSSEVALHCYSFQHYENESLWNLKSKNDRISEFPMSRANKSGMNYTAYYDTQLLLGKELKEFRNSIRYYFDH